MQHPFFKTPLVIVLALSAASCVTVGRHDLLEARVMKLEKFETDMRELSERDTKRFQNLAQQIKTAADELRKNSAGLAAQLGGVVDDERKLRGRLEEIEHLTGRLSAQVDTMGKFLDQRFGLSVTALPPDLPSEPDRLFTYGEQVLKAGQFDLARAVFRHFLTNHGGHEKEDMATIRIAQSYRQQKRYKQALRGYSEIYKKYASVSRKTKPAILDIVLWESAQTLKEWGQCQKARDMFKHLSEFKHLERASAAKSRAKSMKCN